MRVYILGTGPREVIAFHSTGDQGVMLWRDGDDFYVTKVKPGVGWGLVELADEVEQDPVQDFEWARETFDDVVDRDPVYAPTVKEVADV